MLGIRRNLELPKLSQLAMAHRVVSQSSSRQVHILTDVVLTKSIGWTNLLCLFLSGSVIAAQRIPECVSKLLKRLLLWLPCHIRTLPPTVPFSPLL